MRRPDARCAYIHRPNGVARSFHVSANKVEQSKAVLARCLPRKGGGGGAPGDGGVKPGPQGALIGGAGALAGGAKRLARARAGPDGAAVGPSGAAEGVGPDSDA